MLDGVHACRRSTRPGCRQKGGPVALAPAHRRTPPIGPAPTARRRGRRPATSAFDVLVAADARHLALAVRAGATARWCRPATVADRADGAPTRDVAVPDDAARCVERITGRAPERDRRARRAGRWPTRCSATHMPANLLLVGAAYQRGALPVSAEAIERAIELNGVAVRANIAAFRWGRGRGRRSGRGRRRDRGWRPDRPADAGRSSASWRAETPAARGHPGAAARRLPGLPHGPSLRERPVDGLAGRAAARGGHGVLRGRRAGPVQADGVQGRVRGRAAAHRPGVRGPAGRRGAGRHRLRFRLHPPMLRGARPAAASSRSAPGSAACAGRCAAGRSLRGTALDPFGRAADAAARAGVAGRVPRARVRLAADSARTRTPRPSPPRRPPTWCAATRTSSSPECAATGRAWPSWGSPAIRRG